MYIYIFCYIFADNQNQWNGPKASREDQNLGGIVYVAEVDLSPKPLSGL